MTHLDVIARNGVPFRALIDEDSLRAAVAFYDRRYPHTEHGQFTGARYYISTLLDMPADHGLNLYGGVSDWSLDTETFRLVLDWLRTRVETADLWDALKAADDTLLPGVIGLARRDGASWSFISHATQCTGQQVRALYDQRENLP